MLFKYCCFCHHQCYCCCCYHCWRQLIVIFGWNQLVADLTNHTTCVACARYIFKMNQSKGKKTVRRKRRQQKKRMSNVKQLIRTLVGSPTIPSTKHEMHSPSIFNILALFFSVFLLLLLYSKWISNLTKNCKIYCRVFLSAWISMKNETETERNYWDFFVLLKFWLIVNFWWIC